MDNRNCSCVLYPCASRRLFMPIPKSSSRRTLGTGNVRNHNQRLKNIFFMTSFLFIVRYQRVKYCKPCYGRAMKIQCKVNPGTVTPLYFHLECKVQSGNKLTDHRRRLLATTSRIHTSVTYKIIMDRDGNY